MMFRAIYAGFHGRICLSDRHTNVFNDHVAAVSSHFFKLVWMGSSIV